MLHLKVTASRGTIHVHIHFSSLLSHPSETQISPSVINTLVKGYVQSSLAQCTYWRYFQVRIMHNIKVQRSRTLHASSSRSWPSIHQWALCMVWAWNGAIISNMVWKLEALKTTVSRICIMVGWEDQLILLWAHQTATRTSGRKRIYWKAGKKRKCRNSKQIKKKVRMKTYDFHSHVNSSSCMHNSVM